MLRHTSALYLDDGPSPCNNKTLNSTKYAQNICYITVQSFVLLTTPGLRKDIRCHV